MTRLATTGDDRYSDLSICSDCLYILANGQCEYSSPEDEARHTEGMAQQLGDHTVTLGRMIPQDVKNARELREQLQDYAEENNFDEDIVNAVDVIVTDLAGQCGDAYGDEYGDDEGFSWRRCDGCGSTLGGDRYAATLWLR